MAMPPRPRAPRFDEINLDLSRLFLAQEKVVAMDAYLHRASEPAPPHDRAVGPLGESHIGQPSTDLATDLYGPDNKVVPRQ